MSNGADLPDDVELLKALLVEARSLLVERDVEIEQLKAQIDKLRRMQFGRNSELNRAGFVGDRRVWRYAARAESTRFRL
jgi:hypothetical protein